MPLDDRALERGKLLTEFLAAVKGCQVRYGGRTELATESDTCVATLCQCLEETLSHGLRTRLVNRSVGTIRQVTDLVSSGFLTLANSEPDQPVLWWYVRELLTHHEYDRFLLLHNVNTDLGRGRAWLRSLLNEHSLERYIHIISSDEEFLELWYEPWALLRDQERAAMLPNLAAGLDCILFAINIDNEAFNEGEKSTVNLKKEHVCEEPEAQVVPLATSVQSDPVSLRKSDYKRRKKKVPSHIISFDEENLPSFQPVTTTVSKFHSAPNTCINSPAAFTGNITPYTDTFSKIESEKCNKDVSFSDQPVEDTKSVPSDCGTVMQVNEEPTYNEIIENLLVNQTVDQSSLQSFPYCLSNSGAAKPQHQENVSFTSSTSIEGSKFSNKEEVNEHSLTPLTGEPHNLIPLSPDGETPFDFSGIEDHISIKSSSQGEYDSEGLYGEFDTDKVDEDKKDIGSPLSLKSGMSTGSELSSPSVSKETTITQSSFSSLTIDELRTAVLEISRARDSIELKRAELSSALSKEMEVSSTLRAHLAHEKDLHSEAVERFTSKINTLSRENELLRHQLKKYVGAVQMLRREGGSESGPCLVSEPIPHPKLPPDLRDYHDEAAAYESKLIQVAEMHGELMEFNERLQKLLKFREYQVKRFKDELVELRGPFPDEQEEEVFDTVSITSDLETFSSPRTLINIWIPTAFLAGPSSDTHHVYQIYARIRDDEWNVYRRFAQFYELHKMFKKREPIVKTFDFPQKKAFGNKDLSVVEDRRLRLQQYLRKLVNLLVSNSDLLATEPDKASLTSALPFLLDVPQNRDSGMIRSDRSTRKFLSRLSSRQLSQQVSPQYNGL